MNSRQFLVNVHFAFGIEHCVWNCHITLASYQSLFHDRFFNFITFQKGVFNRKQNIFDVSLLCIGIHARRNRKTMERCVFIFVDGNESNLINRRRCTPKLSIICEVQIISMTFSFRAFFVVVPITYYLHNIDTGNQPCYISVIIACARQKKSNLSMAIVINLKHSHQRNIIIIYLWVVITFVSKAVDHTQFNNNCCCWESR